MHPTKSWSRAVQAAAEGGLFALGLVLVTAGTAMVSEGEALVGAIAVAAGGGLMILNRFIHLPK